VRSKPEEFINDVMYALERTNTLDGYYFSSRIAGMTVKNVSGLGGFVAATNCQGEIYIDLDKLADDYPDMESQALVMAHEVRHNDGLHGDRLEGFLEKRPLLKSGGPQVLEKIRGLSNILTDLVINEGLMHTFPQATSFASAIDKNSGVTWNSLKKAVPEIHHEVVKVGYTQSNVWKMDAFDILENILPSENDLEKALQEQQGQGDQGINNNDQSSEGSESDDNDQDKENVDRGDGGEKSKKAGGQNSVSQGGIDIENLDIGDFNPEDMVDSQSLPDNKVSIDGKELSAEELNSGLKLDPQSAKINAIAQANHRAKEAGLKGVSGVGCVPGHLVGEIESFNKPKVNFKNLLRNALTEKAKVRPSKINKRWAGKQGIWEPRLGGESLGTVALLIDTSYSMSDKLLLDMMSEADNALRTLNYRQCVVVQFSNQVENVKVYDQRHRVSGLSREVYGRGGTMISKALDELKKHRDLSATIVMTDGGLYDVKYLDESHKKVLKRSSTFWFVEKEAGDHGFDKPLRDYVNGGGAGKILYYEDEGLTLAKKPKPEETVVEVARSPKR